MGVCGVVGFFAFSSSIPIGVSGGMILGFIYYRIGALGIILGAVIGSRLRRKMDLTKLSRE